MKFIKKGRIFCPDNQEIWWKSHAMAPSAVLLNDQIIRVFVGAWDELGISRIAYIDVNKNNPFEILKISENPVLNIGNDGMFDENGVFPAHANLINNKIYLYYTGFQLGYKIRHYNFGGLALGADKDSIYKRISRSPVLDRKEEGLLVRAGQSVFYENDCFRTVYSAGSHWIRVGGKDRPTYNIYYQESKDGVKYYDNGKAIISADQDIEHGLGRPQIIKLKGYYYVFYTRRILSMKYFFGVAKSKDCINWERIDNQIEGISHSENDWDSEMVYFPSVVDCGNKIYMFYCGNGFGKTGFGFAEIVL